MSRGRFSYEHGLDLFAVISHAAVALLAAASFEAIAHLELVPKIALGLGYFGIAVSIYIWLKRKNKRAVNFEIDKWRRYHHLKDNVATIVGAFIKDRYQLNHKVSSELEALLTKGRPSVAGVEAVFRDADKERRSQVKSALGQLSSSLVDDAFLKPVDADHDVQDRFKVSFYAVENERGEEVLRPKWRYYPNEGEPRTEGFKKGEGVAGRAWEQKRIQVCEEGGDDPHFKDMWDGGGQRGHYASMICVPAIEDIPAERLSDVLGILTVDSPIRRGYFNRNLEHFWADLVQPICNILVYLHEAERLTKAVTNLVLKLGGASDEENAREEANVCEKGDAGIAAS